MPAATRRTAATLILLLTSALLVGCGVGQNITGYGSDLEANFVSACETDVQSRNGSTTTIAIEVPKGFCKCVYDKLHEKYAFDFDKLKEYESKVASAKDGSVPPLPDEVAKSMNDCKAKTAGPVVPSTTKG